MWLVVEDYVFIDFVGEYQDIGVVYDVGQCGYVGCVYDVVGWVVWGVDYDYVGFGCDCCVDFVLRDVVICCVYFYLYEYWYVIGQLDGWYVVVIDWFDYDYFVVWMYCVQY